MCAPSGSICPAPPVLFSFSSKVRSSMSYEAGLLLILNDIIYQTVLIAIESAFYEIEYANSMQQLALGPSKF